MAVQMSYADIYYYIDGTGNTHTMRLSADGSHEWVMPVPQKSKLDLAREFLREVEARHPERKIKRIDSKETDSKETYEGTD